MESQENERTVGYIHNVSPLKQGHFFECQLQTSSKTVRTVCFSPGKRRVIVDYSDNNVPVELKKFKYETKYNSEDIVIDENTIVNKCNDITFEKQLVPDTTKTIEIATLKSISVGQLVSVKGKVISSKPVKNVKPTLRMKEVNIVDNTGSIKLILWENYVDQVEINNTYNFENVRLKKNSYTKDVYINTAKNEETTITSSTPFQDSLAIPQEGNDCITQEADLIGIETVQSYLACIKCAKKLEDSSSAIATCPHCNIRQKTSACKRMWFTQCRFDINHQHIVLTIFNDVFSSLLNQTKTTQADQLTVKQISDLLLELPKLELTYDKRKKNVESALLIS